MARPGTSTACLYLRTRTQRPMETLLHRGAIRVDPARGRTCDDALGQACCPASHAQQARFKLGRLTRLRMSAATAVVGMTIWCTATAQNLRRGEELPTRRWASCQAVRRTA